MLDLNPEIGAAVDKRLREAQVIWLTTVAPDGAPHPNPVWFYWDGEVIILYSQPAAYRIRNIRHNPRVAFNLDGADASGNGVLILNGEAELIPDYPSPHPRYVEKYKDYIPQMNATPEQLFADYSVEIRVRPLRVRGM